MSFARCGSPFRWPWKKGLEVMKFFALYSILFRRKKIYYFRRVEKRISECDQGSAKCSSECRLGGIGVVFSAVMRGVYKR